MPRKPRKPSSLCIHHVILRGVNQQIIFEDTNDYLQFINILKYYKKICNFKLYAYCLMNNHIHLLLEHTTTDLDIIMKKSKSNLFDTIPVHVFQTQRHLKSSVKNTLQFPFWFSMSWTSYKKSLSALVVSFWYFHTTAQPTYRHISNSNKQCCKI